MNFVCQHCNAELDIEDDYYTEIAGFSIECPECGKSISVPSPKKEITIKFKCSNCKASLEADSGYEGSTSKCPNCGKDVKIQPMIRVAGRADGPNKTDKYFNKQAASNQSKVNSLYISLIASAILIVIASTVFRFFFGGIFNIWIMIINVLAFLTFSVAIQGYTKSYPISVFYKKLKCMKMFAIFCISWFAIYVVLIEVGGIYNHSVSMFLLAFIVMLIPAAFRKFKGIYIETLVQPFKNVFWDWNVVKLGGFISFICFSICINSMIIDKTSYTKDAYGRLIYTPWGGYEKRAITAFRIDKRNSALVTITIFGTCVGMGLVFLGVNYSKKEY